MMPPKIREAQFEDYEQIAALEASTGLATKPFDEWRHLWLDNPVYRALPHWPIGWVLEDEAGRVVGNVNNIPLWYEFRGARLLISAGHAWTVDPKYRSYGLLLMETYFDQPGVDLYLGTTVNGNAAATFSVFDSPRIPAGAWDRAGFWVTRYRGFARSVARMKKLPAPGLLAAPISAALRIKSITSGYATPRAAEGIEECAAFDERFDAFWEALRCRQRNMLLGVRSRQVLNWHFEWARRKGEMWIATASDGSGLLGYAVFVRRDVPEIGLRRMRLADFQALNSRECMLAGFLGWAIEKCRREGIDALETVGSDAAPFQRRLPAWCYYYKPSADQGLADALRDAGAWDPSSFDGDASL
jgi:hypothetical protein